MSRQEEKPSAPAELTFEQRAAAILELDIYGRPPGAPPVPLGKRALRGLRGRRKKP